MILLFTSCSKNIVHDTYFNRIKISEVKNYVILLSQNPTPNELFSANTLKYELELLLKRDIKILNEGESIHTNYISIGNTESFKKKINDPRFRSFNSEESGVFFKHNNIYLVGGERRGAYYAICNFLEQLVGIFLLDKDEYFFKKSGNDEILFNDTIFKVAFDNRSIFYSNSLDKLYTSRNKMNLFYEKNLAYEEIGGSDVCIPSGTHTFDFFVSKEIYYYSKPEYYSDRDDKIRNIDHCTQLCLSNQEVYEIVKKSSLQYLKSNSENRFLNFAANDCANTCNCSQCSIINKQEASNFGTLAKFLNKLALDINSHYPNTKIVTLAYLDLANPPVSKLNKNIIVRLSTDTVSWNRPFKPIRLNNEFTNRLANWKLKCDEIWIYDYSCNFNDYFLIHPILYAMSDNLRYYNKMNVKGITIESYYENNGVEESKLKPILMSKLLINPYQNIDSLIFEFNNLYYGYKDGKIINEYYKLIYNNPETYYSQSEINFDDKTVNSILYIIDKLYNQNNYKSNTKVDDWLLPILYTLIKNYNDVIEPKKYYFYINELERILKYKKYLKKASFDNDWNKFITIHKAKSIKAVENNFQLREKEQNIIIDASKLIIYNPTNDRTKFPYIIEDNLAINGVSVKIPATNQDWLVRFEPNEDFVKKYSKYKFCIRFRCEKNGLNINKDALVIGVGAYNFKTKHRPLDKYIFYKELKDSYMEIDFGTIEFDAGTVFYIFPVSNSGVNSLILDHFKFKKLT